MAMSHTKASCMQKNNEGEAILKILGRSEVDGARLLGVNSKSESRARSSSYIITATRST